LGVWKWRGDQLLGDGDFGLFRGIKNLISKLLILEFIEYLAERREETDLNSMIVEGTISVG
jgi:hypothetical protein